MKKQKLPATMVHDASSSVENSELKTITEFILSKVKAEKIICFGSTVHNIQNSSCFVTEKKHKTSIPNSYCLLIVPGATEPIPDMILQQRLEEDIKTTALVTIIVHRMDEINTALQHGSSFFTTIYKKGTLLHDNEAEPFAVPAEGGKINNRIIRRETFWGQWFKLSENFLKGAHFYQTEGQNNLAVFMLHQTLQHCYSAMLRVLTGYRSNSNSLRRLLRLIDNILPEASFSSTKHTPENARLTGLLMKGFSDARYNEKFEITTDELMVLLKRIEKILEGANMACLGHLKHLKEGKIPYVA